MDTDHSLAEFADFGVPLEHVRQVIAEVRGQVAAEWFYVFMTGGGGGGGGQSSTRRQRTLLAFASPDAALTFAQRNNLLSEGKPRLRRLSLAQLLLAMVREPSIPSIRLLDDADDAPAGRFPNGLLVERSALLPSPTEDTEKG
jgi:hypothetical protein